MECVCGRIERDFHAVPSAAGVEDEDAYAVHGEES